MTASVWRTVALGGVLVLAIGCESKVDKYLRLHGQLRDASTATLRARMAVDSIGALIAALPAGPSPARDSLEHAKVRASMDWTTKGVAEVRLAAEVRLMDGGQ